MKLNMCSAQDKFTCMLGLQFEGSKAFARLFPSKSSEVPDPRTNITSEVCTPKMVSMH
jgi:hypothetical protein